MPCHATTIPSVHSTQIKQALLYGLIKHLPTYLPIHHHSFQSRTLSSVPMIVNVNNMQLGPFEADVAKENAGQTRRSPEEKTPTKISVHRMSVRWSVVTGEVVVGLRWKAGRDGE